MDIHTLWAIIEIAKWIALILVPFFVIIAKDGIKFGEDLVLALKDGKLTEEEVVILHSDLGNLYQSVSNITAIIEDFELNL